MKKQIFYVIFFIISTISCNNSERKVALLSASNKKGLLAMADSCYSANDFKKSIELFDKIVLLDTTMGEIYYKRGYCKAQIFDYNGSSKDFYKAFALKHRVDESLFNLGCNFAAIGNDTLALKYFSKAYELNPNNNSAKEERDRIRKRLRIIEL